MNSSLLVLKYIKEIFKSKIVINSFLISLISLTAFILSLIYEYNVYAKMLICAICLWFMIYNTTLIIVAYLDLRINHWKKLIYQRVCEIYKELVESKKEYNTKYVETVEFNDVFKLLTTSNDKHIVIMACNFFKTYNRFGCKDKDNKFIISLSAYIYYIERLDEEYIIMHRQNTNLYDC